MEWYFRDISDDPSEKELTQQDQFNNDEVVLAEALVRETIQNSTDARGAKDEVVRVRFAISEPRSFEAHDFFRKLLKGLTPHLKACGIAPPDDARKFLVIEDFQTTGLRGAIDRKDNGEFCGFWRRFGRSNKRGSSGGRWGLGKLVFSSSSQIRSLIGLTRRSASPETCLMGQAILKNHTLHGVEMDSVGFWCREGEKKGLPSTDENFCEEFRRIAGLERKGETGLSLVVPYVLPDIEPEHLITAVLKNYYFPILTGGLVVDVNEKTISAATFDQISSELGSDAIPQSLLSFVRQLQDMRRSKIAFVLPPTWQTTPITADLLGEQNTSKLREQYKAGEMLFIRAPLTVEPKSGTAHNTHIELFLRSATPGERPQTLVVRGSITVPTEGKKAQLPDSHAALVADEERISQLLGDAENPAHTQWNERAEKVRANWNNPYKVLRRVRAVLQEVHALVADRIERDDPLALLDFFSIPKSKEAGRDRKGTTPGIIEFPAARPKPFRIMRRDGGFTVLPNPKVALEGFPLNIHLRCAYDVLNGNPFRRFTDDDFSFYRSGLKIEKQNADFWPTDANEADIRATSPDFKIDVIGFDGNRDLVVEAQI
ncbi:MAG: hypothetical protein AB7K64_09385 [Variibacter sp.]